MDHAYNGLWSLIWEIDLETAIANGLNRLRQAEEYDKATREQIKLEREQKWNEYNNLIRSSLPEILRPLMRTFRDLQYDPPIHSREEVIIIDGEKFGLAPIEVYLSDRKLLEDPFIVEYYIIFGIAHSHEYTTDYYFATGDELFVKEPEVEKDLELLLAKAQKMFSKKLDLEFKAKSAPPVKEPEYIATGEDLPNGLVPDQALLAALRSIVRDEMYRPPEA
jgi:hypothetical protein